MPECRIRKIASKMDGTITWYCHKHLIVWNTTVSFSNPPIPEHCPTSYNVIHRDDPCIDKVNYHKD